MAGMGVACAMSRRSGAMWASAHQARRHRCAARPGPKPQLVLFDFCLAKEYLDRIRLGTNLGRAGFILRLSKFEFTSVAETLF